MGGDEEGRGNGAERGGVLSDVGEAGMGDRVRADVRKLNS
jgi:hypothetical protein